MNRLSRNCFTMRSSAGFTKLSSTGRGGVAMKADTTAAAHTTNLDNIRHPP